MNSYDETKKRLLKEAQEMMKSLKETGMTDETAIAKIEELYESVECMRLTSEDKKAHQAK